MAMLDQSPEVAQAEFERDGKLPDWVRRLLEKESGWVFGKTTMHVQKCPCCKANGVPDSVPPQASEAIADLENDLGHDLDALASEIDYEQIWR